MAGEIPYKYYKIFSTVIIGNETYTLDVNSPTLKNTGTQAVKIDGTWTLQPGESFTFTDGIHEWCKTTINITFATPSNAGNSLTIIGKVYTLNPQSV